MSETKDEINITEKEQNFSEDFCRALEGTMLPIYIIDPETYEILYCNPSMCHYLGGNPTGKLCYKEIRNMEAPCPGCSAMRLYKEGVSEAKEFHHSSGAWALIQASSLNWRGQKLIKITCADITKQKQMEEELRLRNKEYDAVVNQSVTGIMRYDIASDTAISNVDRNLNRVPEYSIPHYSQVVCKSGLVSRCSVSTAWELLGDIQQGLPSKGYDLRLVLKGERTRWCRVNYILIKDEEGKPYRAVVSFYDNTEKREKELAYQNWNARLNALMDEHTSYIEVNLSRNRIEAEGRIGSWNQEVGGSRFSDFIENGVLAETFPEDAGSLRNFFNRERLLGLFYGGRKEDSLEYRTLVDGAPQWYRAELQLVSDPISGDIKMSIVFHNIDSDMKERERLTREAERDSMTGLYNRATAERLIKEVLEQNPGECCCFLVIDLDDLRGINSSLGHPEGDRALKAIADAMSRQFRKGDILGRIGGDEFVVLLRDVPGASGLRTPISNFMKRLSEIKIGPLDDRSVHVSVGCTIGTAGKGDFKTLYEQADLALYYTKATGKNAFNFYVPEMEKREFLYQPRSTVTMTRDHWYESGEFKKLLHAMSVFFPLVISVNLTKNTYYMMEYMAYTTQRARDEGCFDDLIEEGANAFHPEDREGFLAAFRRENLLKAYEEGKRVVGHKGRQLGDDGVYRVVKTVVVFMKEEGSDDICEITLAHVTPPETEELV